MARLLAPNEKQIILYVLNVMVCLPIKTFWTPILKKMSPFFLSLYPWSSLYLVKLSVCSVPSIFPFLSLPGCGLPGYLEKLYELLVLSRYYLSLSLMMGVCLSGETFRHPALSRFPFCLCTWWSVLLPAGFLCSRYQSYYRFCLCLW